MDEQALFAAALELETESARREFLDNACSSEEVRARIEHLLKLRASAEGFLERPAAELPQDGLSSTTPLEEIGQSIGPYKLLEKIGEGGMGAVYMAEPRMTPVQADGRAEDHQAGDGLASRLSPVSKPSVRRWR